MSKCVYSLTYNVLYNHSRHTPRQLKTAIVRTIAKGQAIAIEKKEEEPKLSSKDLANNTLSTQFFSQANRHLDYDIYG
jgi:hypothetical protein